MRYEAPPFVHPTGEPIPVDGSAHLSVLFHGGRGHTADGSERTYTGPRQIKPDDLEFVREIREIEDFEATLHWVIGLDQRRAFNVIELDGPDRLVIDIGPPTSAPTGEEVAASAFFTPESSLQQTCRTESRDESHLAGLSYGSEPSSSSPGGGAIVLNPSPYVTLPHPLRQQLEHQDRVLPGQ